jgi:5-methylthioadenosine/S-adenosylhomocysteine deaminase
MLDLLITGGTVITMDSARRIIEDGAIAIKDDRIVAVGETSEVSARYQAKRTLDASRKVIMPGLIDGHSHAGHGLTKSIGMELPDAWEEIVGNIYAHGSTPEFWYADAMLTALERLKAGVTCSLSYLGGGDSVMRSDDPAYGARHCEAIEQVGIRVFLAVGPRRPPFPSSYAAWNGENRRDVLASFEDQLQTCENLINQWHGKAQGRVKLAMMFPTHHPELGELTATETSTLRDQATAARQLSRQHGLLFTQDGHTGGTVKYAHEVLDILGPDALLSHSTELTPEEIKICQETGTVIVHNPSAVASIMGRCPVTELIDAGVNVVLGSDAAAPDRSYDMFRHMFQCMRYHRRHFRDPSTMPAGKVLEMTTIDAARGLGLETEIGSLEPGKKADLILVDMFKPHLMPLHMPVHRIAYFANGGDVDTVIVDGKILMAERKVTTVDEAEVLNLAQKAMDEALERTGTKHLLGIPDRFWGVSKGLH